MADADNEMKSALDIAMEKAERLGSLTYEESRHLQEGKLINAGEALAKRYLSGLPVRDLDIELGRFDEKERTSVLKSLVFYLFDLLDITRIEGLDKSLYVIQHLTSDTDTAENISSLFAEYQVAVQRARDEKGGALKEAKRSVLERIGITGSAVDPAFESTEEWLAIQQSLDTEYQEHLVALKGSLKIDHAQAD